jgi:hypothetical protein
MRAGMRTRNTHARPVTCGEPAPGPAGGDADARMEAIARAEPTVTVGGLRQASAASGRRKASDRASAQTRTPLVNDARGLWLPPSGVVWPQHATALGTAETALLRAPHSPLSVPPALLCALNKLPSLRHQ